MSRTLEVNDFMISYPVITISLLFMSSNFAEVALALSVICLNIIDMYYDGNFT